jgi:shikimate kinase/3-dehydroquinate synthase
MSDGVVLVGLSGSGKSSVGRSLAQALDRPFVDTDELIAGPRGDAGARLRALGESAFREAETRAVGEALRVSGAVIATGGGALDDPLNRWRLWEHGVAVWLDAPDATLLGRLARDPIERPMLSPDPVTAMAALRRRREPFYRAADVAFDVSGPAERVTRDLAQRLGEERLKADRPRRLFDAQVQRHHPMGRPTARLVYGRGLLPTVLNEVLEDLGGDPVWIVDRRVAHLAAADGRTLQLGGGERAKRMRRLERLLGWMTELRAERGDPVVAVGGGTMGDLAGLAAALYARGVPWVAVPTTWLAQADAALGGKVAIDVGDGKNVVGAFWPPSGVVSDVGALRSLPRRQARNGLAEAIKAALIADPVLWRLIENRGGGALRDDEAARYAIIERAARVKLAIVQRDPFESNERRVLNLGHTVGHALEVVSGYRLAHGAAVALGLVATARLSAARGGDPEMIARLWELLTRVGFATCVSADAAAVRRALGRDKKRHAGRQRWILPMAIGQVIEVDDVSDAELDDALRGIGIGS